MAAVMVVMAAVTVPTATTSSERPGTLPPGATHLIRYRHEGRMEPFSASRSNPERARPTASPYIQHYSNKLTFNLSNTVTGVHTMKTRALIAAFALFPPSFSVPGVSAFAYNGTTTMATTPGCTQFLPKSRVPMMP